MRRTLALVGVAVLGVAGLSGPASADSGAGITSHGLAINEIGVDLVNAGSGNNIQGTFVELINHSGSSLNIGGTVVSGCEATGGPDQIVQVTAGISLDPGETYLIADGTYAAGMGGDPRNQAFDVGAPDLVQSDGAVFVDGPQDDSVQWGEPDLACDAPDAGSLPTGTQSLNQDFVNGGWDLNTPTPTAADLS